MTTADVVVVGGGLAGLVSLNAALEAGASAVLIERTPAVGGSTVLSSGLMAFAGTDEQTAAGIDDDEESLRSDIIRTGRGRSQLELVEAYCRDQLTAYRWLKGRGVTFGTPHAGSGQSVPRSHHVDPSDVIESLRRRAVSAGGEVRLEVRSRHLLMEDGHVRGVAVDSAPDPRPDGRIEAGAVVVASGGFSRSEDLLARYAPGVKLALRAGGRGNTGDGLVMAQEAGAAVTDMEFIKGTFGIFPWRSPAEEGTGILAVYQGAIAVNGWGRRFIDESLPYKVIGDACLDQPEALAFQIFDEDVMARSDSTVPIYSFRRRLEAGQIRRASTLPELADQLGIDPKVLTGTVEEYNRRIDDGQPDPFGRATLCGGVGRPSPVRRPPFYGYPSTTVVLATYCGLSVDARARVLDDNGRIIPGLFAAGEVTGGFHGDGYVTGTSLGKAAVFGLVAGRASATCSAAR